MKSKKNRKLLKPGTASDEDVLAYTGHKGFMTFDALNKENQISDEDDRPTSGDKLDQKKQTHSNLNFEKNYYKFRSLNEFENRMQKMLSNQKRK